MSDVRPGRTRAAATGGRPGSSAAARRGGRAPRDGEPGGGGRVFADVRLAVSLALGAVVLGLVTCIGLVVVGWAGDAASGTPWSQAVALGAHLWLLTHLGELAVVSEAVLSTSPADPPTQVPGVVSLAPLGLSLLAATPAWRVGRRVAQRCRPGRSLLLCLAVAAVYAGAGGLAAWSAGTPGVTPVPVAGAVGPAVLALLAAGGGVLAVHARALSDRLPRVVAVQLGRVVPAAVVALAAWLLAGTVLLLAGLLLDLPAVTGVHAALAPGAVGGVLLLLAQLAYLPGAVLWSAAVLAGPGVRVGDGFVTPAGSTVADVPAIPLLAALPDPGPFPLWAWLAPLAVVGAGALAGWHAHRHPSSRGATLTDRLSDAVAVAGLVGVAAAGLAWLSQGSLGPWQPLGADVLMLGAAVTAEVLVGALLAGGTLHLLSGRPIGRRRSALDRAGRAGVRRAGAVRERAAGVLRSGRG